MNFFAVLDINPNVKGMTLVISKNHYESDLSDMPPDAYQRFFSSARTVTDILKQALEVKRVALVVEGMGINHAHIKLYPLHGLTEKFKEMWGKERIFFDTYQGYITTQLGPQADPQELQKLASLLSKY